MKALFITADGLECMQEVPESARYILRPIHLGYPEILRALDEGPKPREYRIDDVRDDGVVIFREVSAV